MVENNDLAWQFAKDWYVAGLTGEFESDEDRMRAEELAERFREYGRIVNRGILDRAVKAITLALVDSND